MIVSAALLALETSCSPWRYAFAAAAPGLVSAEGRGFGWKVTSPRGSIYLVGSVHLLTEDFCQLQSGAREGVQDSSLYWSRKSDIAEMTAPGTQMTTLMRGMQPSSTPLDKSCRRRPWRR